jgi:bifunctional DNA primase/polymerase-like protein
VTVEKMTQRIQGAVQRLDLTALAEEVGEPLPAVYDTYLQAQRAIKAAELATIEPPEWETPDHTEVDPFDADYDAVMNTRTATVAGEPGLIPFVQAAIGRGFHVFGLTPKDKVTLPGSHGFKDSKSPSDPLVLDPWNQDPNRNIGIDLGASDLCVLDFDKLESIPAWLNETKTYKVRTARGVHVYFRGARKTTGLYVDGSKVGDVKSTGGYTLAAGSVHPSGAIYTVIDDSPIAPLPNISSLIRHESEQVNASPDGPPIPRGGHDNELTRIAGVLRNAAMSPQKIEEHLIEVCEKRCENYGSDYREMCKKIAHSIGKKPVGQAAPGVVMGGHTLGQTSPETFGEHRLEFSEDTDVIPEFDSSVVNGIYAKFVELMTRGTTLVPQYAFLAAKTYIGLRLAGKVKFATVDAQPRYFGVAIGETGSGKGAAWSRLLQILNACGSIKGSPGMIKVLNGVDSGAGLKDFFFEDPQDEGVLAYIDEAATYANKATATRNPSALDDLLELVDQTSISRTLSAGKSKKVSKKKTDAYLAMYMCAQDGDVLLRLFSGRGKLGALDRLTPEYSVPVKPGRMPEISPSDAIQVLVEVTSMIESVKDKTIGIQPEAEALLEKFWDAQVPTTQTKVRWRKYILVDAYMSAFGEGRDTATVRDMQIAIRVFERQLILRRAFFKNMDVTDKVGYYLAKCKVITEWMQVQQAAGRSEWVYAQSKRDYETKTHAYRTHEEAFFDKAWVLHSKGRLSEIRVKKSNGREYTKYVPQPEEPE